MERLSFLGGSRLAVSVLRGGKTIRIEAYNLSTKEAAELVKQFGGQAATSTWVAPQRTDLRKPIVIRKQLLVVSSDRERQLCARKYPDKKIVLVPAAMAFGTGEHATTAQCLRFLSDVSDGLRGEKWKLLDLGTGSGILAIAGRLLGADKVDAFDFDPHAVRTARENVDANEVNRVVVKRGDVTLWTPPQTWDVVTANLFSEVLIRAASAIAHATRLGGRLIFSGILREQEKECVRAFSAQGFRVEEVSRKGKWVTVLAKKMP